DDSAVENTETVILTIVASAAYTTGSPNSATVTIADNDQPAPAPVVSVVASDMLAGEVGPNTGAFEISRTGNTNAPVTVRFALTGSAQNGVDYQRLALSV